MPSSIKPSFAPTLLALSLALGGAPAQADERYWTFIGGCGTSTDWFGKTNGPNAQGKGNCWAATAGGTSGQSLPTIDDRVYIQHNGAQDLVNTLALPGRDATLTASAYSLTVQGMGQGFASLAIASNVLHLRQLNVGAEGKGAIQQSGGTVTFADAVLGRETGGVGRYELSGGLVRPSSDLNILSVGHSGQGQWVQSGGDVHAMSITIGSATAISSWTMTGGVASAYWGVDVGYTSTVIEDMRIFDPSASGRLEVGGTAKLFAPKLLLAAQGRLTLTGGTVSVANLLMADASNFRFFDGTLALRPAFSDEGTGSSHFADLQVNPLPLRFGAGLEAGLPTVRLEANANLSVPEIQVGSFGRGRLEVLQGAVLTSERAGVGNSAAPLGVRSEALLDGADASWTVGGRLDIGGGDMATVTVRNGAQLVTGLAALGDTPMHVSDSERNELRIEGSGSQWRNTGDLWVGGGAAGAGRGSDLQLVSGGRLSVGGTLHVHAGSSLLVENGGSWAAGRTVNEGLIEIAFEPMTTVDGPLELRGGSRLYVDGPLTLNGSLDVAAGATLETLKALQLNGPVTLHGGAVLTGAGTKAFEGGLALGDNALSTVVDGDGTAEFGYGNTLLMDIGGAAPGSFDRYVTSGSLQLGGTLVLMPWQGYTGQAGDSFDLFDGALSGSFDRIYTANFTLAPGLRWDFSQLSSTGVVSITAVPEPGTWALWLGGLAALGMLGCTTRRRRASQTALLA